MQDAGERTRPRGRDNARHRALSLRAVARSSAVAEGGNRRTRGACAPRKYESDLMPHPLLITPQDWAVIEKAARLQFLLILVLVFLFEDGLRTRPHG